MKNLILAFFNTKSTNLSVVLGTYNFW